MQVKVNAEDQGMTEKKDQCKGKMCSQQTSMIVLDYLVEQTRCTKIQDNKIIQNMWKIHEAFMKRKNSTLSDTALS